MIRYKRKQKAQALGEYVIVIALVIAVIISMTILIRKALMGRLRDARRYMADTINNNLNNTDVARLKACYDCLNSTNCGGVCSIGACNGVTLLNCGPLCITPCKPVKLDLLKQIKDASTVAYEYEPYYAEATSNNTRQINDRGVLTRGGSTGVFNKTYDETTSVESRRVQASPKDAD